MLYWIGPKSLPNYTEVEKYGGGCDISVQLHFLRIHGCFSQFAIINLAEKNG